MTLTLKKRNTVVSSGAEYYSKFYKAPNNLKPVILNYLFRNITFVTRREKIRALTSLDYGDISESTKIPVIIIHKFVSSFLVDLLRFKAFLLKYPQVLNSKKQDRKVRIFLHKIYRLAPVFDYKRARENIRRLKNKLNQLFFWPQVMTQVAIVIFITDLLDQSQERKITQANLRSLCSCSAYAFHRTRNRIGLTSNYVKNI